MMIFCHNALHASRRASRHVTRILSGEQARAAAKVNELLDKAIEEKKTKERKEKQ